MLPQSVTPPPRPTPIRPEDLDLTQRSKALVGQVTDRPEVRQRLRGVGKQEMLHQLLRQNGRRGLEIAGQELVDLYNAGATAPELQLYALFVDEIIGDLFVGQARPEIPQLLREDADADAEEDRVISMLALSLSTATAQDLISAARVQRRQAASSLAVARALEAEARRKQLGFLPRRSA